MSDPRKSAEDLLGSAAEYVRLSIIHLAMVGDVWSSSLLADAHANIMEVSQRNKRVLRNQERPTS